MKYMLLFIDEGEWEMTPENEHVYAAIGAWWEEHAGAGRIVGGHELQPPRTATTVTRTNGQATVTDGPFMEAKETIGGYAILDVPDLDAAIAVAKTWPAPDSKVEIRPLVVR